jgi:hypothetical protein
MDKSKERSLSKKISEKARQVSARLYQPKKKHAFEQKQPHSARQFQPVLQNGATLYKSRATKDQKYAIPVSCRNGPSLLKKSSLCATSQLKLRVGQCTKMLLALSSQSDIELAKEKVKPADVDKKPLLTLVSELQAVIRGPLASTMSRQLSGPKAV